MTLFDFAKNNIIRDRRNYIYYFINCVFSVFTLFLFTVLSFHPAMAIIDKNSTMGLILFLGEFISIIFSLSFISYSVSCFLKTRNKQFGLITILGASKKQINKLIFLENMLVGFASIVTGIIVGLVFSKFFLDVANKVIGVNNFTFYFPAQAILTTSIGMSIVFLMIAYFTPKFLKKKEIVYLIKSDVSGEKKQQLFIISGIFSVLCCFLIWIFSSDTELANSIKDSVLSSSLGIIAYILGTYLIFSFGIRIWLILTKNTKTKTKLLYNSDRRGKMKSNVQVMTVSATLYALTFFSMITLLSLATNVKSETEKIMPYAVSYNVWDDGENLQDITLIESHLSQLPGYQNLQLTLSYNKETNTRSVVLPVSEYNKIMKFIGKKPIELSSGDVYLVSGNVGEKVSSISSDIKVLLDKYGKSKIVGSDLNVVALSGFTSSVHVISDDAFQVLKKDVRQKKIHAYKYYDWENDEAIIKNIEKELKLPDKNKNLISASSYYRASRLQNNLTLYIGSMLCFTFILAVASFVYSRLYSELEKEVKKYKGIAKTGLSKKELIQVLNKETLLVLIVPFITALIYMWIGIFALEKYTIISNVDTALKCTVILIPFQFVVYLFVNSEYKKVVLKKVFNN